MCGKFFKKNFSSVTVCFFLFSFLFSACGLESLYYLEPPTSSREVINNTDRIYDYFSFFTGDNSSLGDEFKFQGTVVYYKIFADESEARSSYQAISNSNTSSDISAAASQIVNGKKYVPLYAQSVLKTDVLYIEENQAYVEIRLNKIKPSESSYPNGIFIGNVKKYSPKRDRDGSKKVGFEFSKVKDTDNNPCPKYGDKDFSASDSSVNSSGEWYVDAWAFAIGHDNSYSPSYSRALHLGCIKISADEYDN